MKRVVSYLRISTVNQIDNTSIEVQREKIDLYCKLNNIDLVKEFKDEGLSAKGIEARDQYKEMMNYVRDPKNDIDGILVYKADRVHRSLKNLMIMIDELEEISVSFVSITEQFDTSSPQGLLFLQMIGSFSEFERKIIAERTKSGRIANAKKEVYAGGRVPFGYKLVDGKLLINDEEAKIIQDIFKLRCKNKSLSFIGKKYNMSKQRVDYIIKNSVYMGKYNYDGEVEKNKISYNIPSIVSRYTWNKANLISSI